MAQPPPRKGAFSKHCQNVTKEQHSKLQLKVQQENDLLEDVRSFVKQKAIIEKTYADAMLKLSTSASHKRIASLLDIIDEPSGSNKVNEKNVYTIWKHLLDENEKIAKARLAAVQVLQEEVEKDAKVLRNSKQSQAKKALERLGIVQKEVQQCVAEVDRTKRAYFDDESSALDLRDKAKDADDRSKGKKKDVMSLFHSKSTLKKHAGKLSAKQEECDIRSTGARNDYILSLASANAHQDFYFKHDLQDSIRSCELSFYEKISTYLNTVARTEVLTTTAVLSSFTNIRDQAECISRDYNYNCYMQAYPCFREHINYDFEPVEGDSTTIITPSEHDGGYSLNYEARQNASKLNQAAKTIKAYNKRIQACHYHKTKGLKQEPNDTGGPDLNTKIIELQIAIRNAEMEKARAEARLEKLREGGISVDEYIDAAVYTPTPQETTAPPVQKQESRTSDSRQITDQADEWPATDEVAPQEEQTTTPGYTEERASEDQVAQNSTGQEQPQASGEGWASWEQQNQAQYQTYDYNQSWAEFDTKQEDQGGAPTSQEPESEPPAAAEVSEPGPTEEKAIDTQFDPQSMGRARVLFDFESHAPDELSVREQESIFVLYNECDEEGWVMAQNSSGTKGYVPQNYLEVETQENGEAPIITEETHVGVNEPVAATTSYQDSFVAPLETQGYNNIGVPPKQNIQEEEVEEEEDSSSEASDSSSDGPPLDLPPPPPPPQQSASPVKTLVRPSSMALSSSGVQEYCKALYDYTATGTDEITFVQGQIIRILNKDPNGINDGWWLGEPYEAGIGKSGLFPSIVVEECLENGESAEEEESSDSSIDSPDSSIAPPCFTPPGMESRKKLLDNQPSVEVVVEEEEEVADNITDVPVVEAPKEVAELPIVKAAEPPIVKVAEPPTEKVPEPPTEKVLEMTGTVLKSSVSEKPTANEEIKKSIPDKATANDKEVGISDDSEEETSSSSKESPTPPLKTKAAPLMPPIMVTNPTPMDPFPPEESKNDPPPVSFSVETPNFEMNISEEAHEVYKKAASVPPAPPQPPPLPPSPSLNSTDIVVTAPTPRIQSPVQANENDKKRNIIEELKQHPAFKEKKNKAETTSGQPKPPKQEAPKEDSLENKIEEIQKKIEPAVQEIEQKALHVAKEAVKRPIPTITTDPPETSSSSEDEEDTKTHKEPDADSSSSDSSASESGPDHVSSSEEEEEEGELQRRDATASSSSINPLPPDELEMRQLKKLDKLKESSA